MFRLGKSRRKWKFGGAQSKETPSPTVAQPCEPCQSNSKVCDSEEKVIQRNEKADSTSLEKLEVRLEIIM